MSDQENERPSVPVPVRVAVARHQAAVRAAEAAEHEFADGAPAESESIEVRSVQWDGAEWSVCAEGLSRSGLVGDSGATLVSLAFQPPAGAGRPQRRALVPGLALSELSDFQLELAIAQGRDVSQ